jgi:hypothetical protein
MEIATPVRMTKNKKAKIMHLKSKEPILRKGDVPVTRNMLFSVRDQLKEEISSLRHDLTAQIHRLGVLMEEQNARNAFVLDGYASLFERQALAGRDRIEKKLDEKN